MFSYARRALIRLLTKVIPASLIPVTSRSLYSGGWTQLVREPFAGAWQRNLALSRESVLSYSTVWACVTLIASDIAKLPIRLLQRDSSGIWSEVENPAYSPVLRKPNHYQTHIKFLEYWMICKLVHGNAYVYKSRDQRGVVDALYILDPTRVKPYVATNGDVYYQIGSDILSGITENSVVVPASEIIHDLMVPLFHPLVGVSPIFACGLAAMQGLNIQSNSSELFSNGSQLSGVILLPGPLSDESLEKYGKQWESKYTGPGSVGKTAILDNGATFQPLTMTATDAQLIDQLKWTAEQVCACFHVPGYMVGIGPAPPYTDIQSINLQYYTQALQNPIENIEVLLDEGLGLALDLGTELDITNLARMDTKTTMETQVAGVGAGIFTPNEARAEFSLKPKTGGETPYLQQQNWPLQQLAERPTPTNTTPTPAATPAASEPEPRAIVEMFQKELAA